MTSAADRTCGDIGIKLKVWSPERVTDEYRQHPNTQTLTKPSIVCVCACVREIGVYLHPAGEVRIFATVAVAVEIHRAQAKVLGQRGKEQLRIVDHGSQ
jgi:hypothetical protein